MAQCKFCYETYDHKKRDYNGCCCTIHSYKLNKMKFSDISEKIKSETPLDSYISLSHDENYNGYTINTLFLNNIIKDKTLHDKLINNSDDILEKLSFKEMVYVINNIEKCNINIFLTSTNDMYVKETNNYYFSKQFLQRLKDIENDRRDIVEAFFLAYKLSLLER